MAHSKTLNVKHEPSREAMEAEVNELQQLITDLQKKLRPLQKRLLSSTELSSPEGVNGSRSELKCDNGNCKAEADKLRDEILLHRQKIKELVDKNVRWQEFNEERDKKMMQLQELIHKLTLKVAELEQKRSEEATSITGLNFKSDREIKSESLIEQQKTKIYALETCNNQLLEKIERLNLELRQTMSEFYLLQDQTTRQVPSERERMLIEENQLLKMQVEANKEDFESERNDRERAQQQVEQLKQQFSQLIYSNSFPKQQVDTFQFQPWTASDNLDYVTSDSSALTSHGVVRRPQQSAHSNYQLYQTDYYDEVDGETDENLKCSVEEKTNDLTVDKEEDEKLVVCSSDSKEILKCPKCQKEFESLELMAHFDNSECANTNQ